MSAEGWKLDTAGSRAAGRKRLAQGQTACSVSASTVGLVGAGTGTRPYETELAACYRTGVGGIHR